jgi:predicted transcriptional regulator
MTVENVRVAGVREEGGVSAYILLRDFEEGSRVDSRKSIGGDQVVGPDASLTDVIEVLTRHDFCFVGSPENVTGVIARSDIEKPVARMWLFGFITLLSLSLTVGRGECIFETPS